MWIFSLDGMLSIVRHRDYVNIFLVRSRSKRILQRIFPEFNVIVMENADYRFRVIARDWEVLSRIMQESKENLKIGYTNYKLTCNMGEDPEFTNALGRVWEVMYDYQERLVSRDL